MCFALYVSCRSHRLRFWQVSLWLFFKLRKGSYMFEISLHRLHFLYSSLDSLHVHMHSLEYWTLCTPGSMNRLFSDFFNEFWPDCWPDFWSEFWPGVWPGFFSKTIQCTVLLGQRRTVLQYYLLFTTQFPKHPKLYFRYSIILHPSRALKIMFWDLWRDCFDLFGICPDVFGICWDMFGKCWDKLGTFLGTCLWCLEHVWKTVTKNRKSHKTNPKANLETSYWTSLNNHKQTTLKSSCLYAT